MARINPENLLPMISTLETLESSIFSNPTEKIGFGIFIKT
jgi:hypothetical protein